MKANDFTDTMKEMGKTAAQAIQDATDVLVQSHKQGAQTTRQWMELGFDAAAVNMTPVRDACLGATDAWVRGVEQAAGAVNGVMSRVQATPAK